MVAVIRQVHDGMKTWVRKDKGLYSEEFDTEQGLHPRVRGIPCVVRHLLRRGIPRPRRYRKDPGILSFTFRDCGRCVHHSRSRQGLVRMMVTLVYVSEALGLTVSEKKPKPCAC